MAKFYRDILEMIHCSRIESGMAVQTRDFKLSLDMRQTVADTEQRRQAEDLLPQ